MDRKLTLVLAASNILGHLLTKANNTVTHETFTFEPSDHDIRNAVKFARAIADEVERTEPNTGRY